MRKPGPGTLPAWHHGVVTTAPPRLCLVSGDEELLVEGAIPEEA